MTQEGASSQQMSSLHKLETTGCRLYKDEIQTMEKASSTMYESILNFLKLSSWLICFQAYLT